MSRPFMRSLWRGALARCPRCGTCGLFSGFLATHHSCEHCGLEIAGHRADDAPPYVVMFIVGHVIVGAMLMLEKFASPALWVHAALWMPATLILSLVLLRPVKGGLIGIQWANAMHGFSETEERV